MCFIAMRVFRVDANIVALSGIAIAIGTMVDMGIILCENILKHLDEAHPDEDRLEVVYRASSEVGGAVVTAVSTTIVSFLPVFTMIGAEGKLFKPLAFTKTFALAASVIVALTIIPPVAHTSVLVAKIKTRTLKRAAYAALILVGLVVSLTLAWWAGVILAALGSIQTRGGVASGAKATLAGIGCVAAACCWPTALPYCWLESYSPKIGCHWDRREGLTRNLLFRRRADRWTAGLLPESFNDICIATHSAVVSSSTNLLFLVAPALVLLLGFAAWLGPKVVFGPIPQEFGAQETFRPESFGQLSSMRAIQIPTWPACSRGKWHDDIADSGHRHKSESGHWHRAGRGLAKSSCRLWTKAPTFTCPRQWRTPRLVKR